MFDFVESVVNDAVVNEDEKVGHITTVSDILAGVANFMMAVSFSLSIIGFGYAMIQFIMSSGDPKAIDKATKAAIWSLVTGIVTMMLWGIRIALLRAANITDSDILEEKPVL
jgi:hypothetical protein